MHPVEVKPKTTEQVNLQPIEVKAKKSSFLSKVAIAVSVVAMTILAVYVSTYLIKGWTPGETNLFFQNKVLAIWSYLKGTPNTVSNYIKPYFPTPQASILPVLPNEPILAVPLPIILK